MTRTEFRPSIHGWPFGNSFKYSVAWGIYTNDHVGFCGGMCWRALHYFYRGLPTSRVIGNPPSGGTQLYDELKSAQEESLPVATILKIISWQAKPDKGQRLNILSSLGHETQQEWTKLKVTLDQYKPITLTLITSSNDGNPGHFKDNHRVVAFAYDYLSLGSNNDPGAPSGATAKVTISIYDPNFKMDDDVQLTFYLGGRDSDIRIQHNRGKEVHGFFLDDKDRSFAFVENTLMRIRKCDQIAINNNSYADYNLEFTWRCRVISYFTIQIDGNDWDLNTSLRDQYAPTEIIDSNNALIKAVHKQVPSRIGSLTLPIKLPRKRTVVAVKLLDSNDTECYQSIDIDLLPAIEYQLKIQKSASNPDPAINDNDLFIKNPNPTNSEIQLIDTSPFRWIKIFSGSIVNAPSGRTPGMRDPSISIIKKYRLGNIKVPYLANFKERNLVLPTQISGNIKITKNSTASLKNIPSIIKDQILFDGFTDNPLDYDSDTTVEFNYTAKDTTGISANGKTWFFGKSIIYEEIATAVSLSVYDSAKLAQLESIYHNLVERGLIDPTIDLHRGLGTAPDPVRLLGSLRLQQQIQKMINETFQSLLKDPLFMQECFKEQIVTFKKIVGGKIVFYDKITIPGNALQTTENLLKAKQSKLDDVIVTKFVNKTIANLSKTPRFIKLLKSL